ncbi:MAG: NAD(P)H-dependent oxidoreductase subunit E, partial [Spirochaetia bacterium]
ELLEVIARELKISDGETTADGAFCLETVPCRGMCAEAPIVSINDVVVPLASPEDLGPHLRALADSGS